MFKCKTCSAHQQTIDLLKEQIKFLQKLSSPSTEVTLSAIEADAVLTGHPEPLDYTTSERAEGAELELAQREADRILSGNHENLN